MPLAGTYDDAVNFFRLLFEHLRRKGTHGITQDEERFLTEWRGDVAYLLSMEPSQWIAPHGATGDIVKIADCLAKSREHIAK